MSQPIFYDPKNKRWKYFRTTFQVSGLIFTIIFGIALVSILINPLLPSLGLQSINGLPKKHHLQIPDNKPFIMSYRQKTFQDERKKLDKSIENNKILVKSRKAKNQVNTIGFFVNWDDTSGTSLKQNIDKLDILIPEWVHLRGADGKVEFDDLAKQKRVTTYIRQHRKDLKIMPLINNFKSENENWNTNVLKNMLKSEVSRQKLIANLFDYITSNHYDGINVDFESVDDSSQKNLIIFMKELTQKFHTKNLKVSECVPLDDPAFDYKTLSKYNDYLVLMAYDEHWSTSNPGPVTSQKWYANLISKRFAEVASEKIIVAIGNYGYDWNKKNKSATTVSFQEALTIARESGSKINFDGKSLNPNFDYYDDNESLHHVWFLDATTVFNQLSEAYQYLPYGFALWRMGSEDPSMWQIFDFDKNNQFDENASKKIEKIHYDYDIIYEGKGEVLRITSTPKDGDRKVYYDKDSEVILDAKYNSLPSPYVITRFGGNNKKEIAITFDDGPDADYTPDILDILKKYNVPATFFVIGWNAESNQGIIKRIFHEGHEIGNHTFTHPNISLLPPSQVRLEINTTQRLIESILGRSTDLFRPPYAEDIEPNTADKIKPLAFTGDLGYYTIGMQIDPDDWATPGTNKIVSRVLGQLNNGNIILLHDSGGDRSQTVKALPTIIEELKKRGYTFVTVSKLLGLTRDQVMPKIAKNETSFARVNDIAFITIGLAQISLYYFFIFGIVLGIFRFIFIGLLAVIEANKKDNFPDDFKPTVSVIVPAYNEEKVINNTINSLLKSKYINFDIIVVDDGSKDNTYQKVLDSFSNNIQVKAFTKENAGKSEAVNFGIRQTDAEIILCLDADTIFHPDAIGNLVRHFHNPKVGAVAGNVKIGNRINLLTIWQTIEYITSQNLDRRAFDLLNCITVVPGAIGAWRRDIVNEIGGFPTNTLAEDADLTISVLKRGYIINNEPDAIALTEAPDNFKGFIKQRFRWVFGTLQVTWKHRNIMFRKKYGALGMFALPNIFIFQTIYPFVSPIMDLTMAVSLIQVLINKAQHPLDYSTDNLKHILFYYAIFISFDFFTSALAFMLEKKENWRLLGWVFVQRFVYRQIMYYIGMKAVLTAIRGGLVGWGKLERKGFEH